MKRPCNGMAEDSSQRTTRHDNIGERFGRGGKTERLQIGFGIRKRR